MQNSRLSLDVINVFQILVLLQRVYYLYKQKKEYVCIYLDERTRHRKLRSQVM
jgi:hypothetical protein